MSARAAAEGGAVTVYYVEKRAVYGHGVLGVYETLDAARRACQDHVASPKKYDDRDVYERDGDGHHEYYVLRTALGGGEAVVVARFAGDWNWGDGQRVASYHWEDREV